MLISRKKKKRQNPPLLMNNVPLDEVESYKHLGLTLTKTLVWDNHIENMVTKANQCLNVLNALKFKLDRNSLEQLYFAFCEIKARICFCGMG
jgi:hypothetical protein